MKDSKALQNFAELMIEKIKQVENDWEKPWISNPQKKPQNALTGRQYNGINDLMLYFQTEKMNYKVPAFLTFNQAKEIGASVYKGEKGFPVAFWGKYYYEIENPKNRITPEDYKKLPFEEKEKFDKKLFLQEFTVFNVEQTSIPQVNPELWEKIQAKFETQNLLDETGALRSKELDKLLTEKSWLCPINVLDSNSAYYNPSQDYINVPLFNQFKDGESFYSTLLHEMAHSTGHESRLGRDFSGGFGSSSYGKEELIAELTAAFSASELGISTKIREENAQYLKSWLNSIKEDPKFILSVLSSVHKASTLISERVYSINENIKKNETNTHVLDMGKEDEKHRIILSDINKQGTEGINKQYYSDPKELENVLNKYGLNKTYDKLGTQIDLFNKGSDEEIYKANKEIPVLENKLKAEAGEALKKLEVQHEVTQTQEKQIFIPPVLAGVKIDSQSQKLIRNGEAVYLENFENSKTGEKFNSYLYYDKGENKLKFSEKNPFEESYLNDYKKSFEKLLKEDIKNNNYFLSNTDIVYYDSHPKITEIQIHILDKYLKNNEIGKSNLDTLLHITKNTDFGKKAGINTLEDIHKIANNLIASNASIEKDNFKNVQLISKEEIPFDKLKKAGITEQSLSATDMKNLQMGKETKELSLINSETGLKESGTIKLIRDDKGGINPVFNFVSKPDVKKKIKL